MLTKNEFGLESKPLKSLEIMQAGSAHDVAYDSNLNKCDNPSSNLFLMACCVILTGTNFSDKIPTSDKVLVASKK